MKKKSVDEKYDDQLSERQAEELAMGGDHELPEAAAERIDPALLVEAAPAVYDWHDIFVLQAAAAPRGSYTTRIKSIDELLERDKQREQDGFPRKIRVGRMIKPADK